MASREEVSHCQHFHSALVLRNVKFINESFYNMRCLVMFITAICVLFLLEQTSAKNSFRRHDISQRLNREPPSLSSHFLLTNGITNSINNDYD